MSTKANRLLRGSIVDAGFWIALFDPTDKHHARAELMADQLLKRSILFPWPLLYEVLRTRFVRRPGWVKPFYEYVESLSNRLVDDSRYRTDALREVRHWSVHRARPISLVDMIIRMMLEDSHMAVTHLITFNARDFSDACIKNGVQIEP